jgi:hypothetical protein
LRVWRVTGQRAFELRQVRAERSRGVGARHARRAAGAQCCPEPSSQSPMA